MIACSTWVRFWAAYGLGCLGAEEAGPELERLAATDEAVVPGWWSVKQEARDAIEAVRRVQAWKAMESSD